MDIPTDRKYRSTHEWHKRERSLVVIGITEHAVTELTDVTYVDLPEVASLVTAGEAFGEIESVKATSQLFTAVTGEVAEVNGALADDPGLVNRDPYGEGWLIKVRPSKISEPDNLMSAEAYAASLP